MLPSPGEETVFVRCGSHRARERLFRLLGHKPHCHYDWDRPATGGYYPIPAGRLAEARKIAGVTRARHPEALRACW
jgi:hypothetical protein